MFRIIRRRTLVGANNGGRRFSTALADSRFPTRRNKQTPSVFQNIMDDFFPEPKFSVPSDVRAFVVALIRCKSISQVKQVHALVLGNGYSSGLVVANKLLYVYTQHKAIDDACAVFSGMNGKDSVSWSVMVGGFAKSGDFINCLTNFREMIRHGVFLDNYTLPSVIRACRDKKDLEVGRLIHDVALKFGLESDEYICAALADMYARCRMLDDARKLFDEMPKRDLVTWTVMIGAYAECGRPYESWLLFDQMRNEGVVADKVATVTIANACAKLGAMSKAAIIRDHVNEMKFTMNVVLGTAMIDMYAKCGNLDYAREIFDKITRKNTITWSAMIGAYSYHGQGLMALELFSEMKKSGILPNGVTFVSLLYACSHSGLVEKGIKLFNLMWDDYEIKPNVKHYTCMIDLLGRAGRFDEAEKLIENMTAEKDEALWCALLGACRIHKNIDLAEKAAKSLLELQPQNPGYYILLSNIYANEGKFDEVAKCRNLMTQRNLKKNRGYAWIEADNEIHQFSVADRAHPRSMEIFSMLRSLCKKLELAGYVPDTDFVLHDVDEEVKVEMVLLHCEKLAVAFGLIATPVGDPIRITKNLRVCGDCHTFCKFVSEVTNRVLIVRDANRFHHFKDGECSCGDYW